MAGTGFSATMIRAIVAFGLPPAILLAEFLVAYKIVKLECREGAGPIETAFAIAIVVACAVPVILFSFWMLFAFPLVPWAYDGLTGYDLRLSIDTPRYEFTLQQSLADWGEFYFTELHIVDGDGSRAWVVIDHQDNPWWGPRVLEDRAARCFLSYSNESLADADVCVDVATDRVIIRRSKPDDMPRIVELSTLVFR